MFSFKGSFTELLIMNKGVYRLRDNDKIEQPFVQSFNVFIALEQLQQHLTNKYNSRNECNELEQLHLIQGNASLPTDSFDEHVEKLT